LLPVIGMKSDELTLNTGEGEPTVSWLDLLLVVNLKCPFADKMFLHLSVSRQSSFVSVRFLVGTSPEHSNLRPMFYILLEPLRLFPPLW